MNNRWGVALSGMMILLCSGAVYIWGVFQGPVVEMFHWTQAQGALTYALTSSIFSLGSIFGGKIQDKIGPRKVAVAGGAMIGAGMFCASLATVDKPWVLYYTYGVLMGFGVGTVYTPVIACVLKWFPDKKGMMTGAVVMLMGGGGLVFTPIAKALLATYGVMTTFKIFGLVFGTLIIAASLFLKNPPDGYKPQGWVPSTLVLKDAMSTRDYTPLEMLRKPQFYCLSIIMFIGCMSGLMIIPFGSILAEQAGLSASVAILAIMLISVSNAFGRLFWGAIGDKIGRVKTLGIMLAISGISMLFLNQLQGYVSLVGMGIVIFCYGGFLGAMPSTVGEFFGVKNVGVNYGLVLLSYGLTALGAPVVSGMVKDLTGNFKNAFLISGITSLVGLIFVYMCKPPASRDNAADALVKDVTG